MRQLPWFRHLYWAAIFTAVLVGSAFPAIAATKGPAGMAFYEVPSPLPPGQHGDLIRYRKIPIEVPGTGPVDFWQVMYLSTDALDMPNAVTGSVLVPQAAWGGRGSRPVVSLGAGTQGPAQMCATSLQLEAGTCYEAANIAAGLNAGFAMVVSDYAGYTTGDMPTYMNGFSQGHAALDIIKAARQIPDAAFSDNDDVALWGYSQGGQTAAWAGQMQPSYMPDLKLAGVAAGGVPSDLLNVAANIDGKVGSAFLLQVYLGLYAQYPDEIPLYDIVNARGKTAIDEAQDMCMFEGLFKYMHVSTAEMTIGGRTLDQLMQQYAEIKGRAESMTLGGQPIEAPVYLYHGTADSIIPIEQALELRDAYCELGVQTYFAAFNTAEHVITMFQGAAYVIPWLEDRFKGERVRLTDVCTNGPRPLSDPNDPSGDFIITMDEWHLDSVVHLGRLDQDIEQPEESTFSSDCNVSTKSVLGGIDVPTFSAPVKILGLPLKAGFTLKQAGNMTGNLDIDDIGILGITGSVAAEFIIDGVGLTRRQSLPFTVNTSKPVDIPLEYEGPVSDLGKGLITFQGETRVPRMEGGLMAPIFSVIMSGPLGYRFRVFPKDPTMY